MNQPDDRIKIVVVNEHTFGYQNPGSNSVGILHASILKGAVFSVNPVSMLIGSRDTVRLANEKDFHEFRIEFSQYASRPEEYLIQR